MSLENNPFVHLFPTIEHAIKYSLQTAEAANVSLESEIQLPELFEENIEKKIRLSQEGPAGNAFSVEQDNLVERIFLVTVDNDHERGWNRPDALVRMENEGYDPLHEAIEQILFERLLLSSPKKFLVHPNATSGINTSAEQEASEELPLAYLLQSYNRLLQEENIVAPHLLSTIQKCRRLIIRNLSTALISPELYFLSDSGSSLSIHEQLYDFLTSTDCANTTNPIRRCLYEVAHHVVADDITQLEPAFRPVIEKLVGDLISDKFADLGLPVHLSILILFTGHPNLAEMLLKHDKPNSVLEIVLSKSCLITFEQKNEYQFFENVRTMGKTHIEDEENVIHDKLEKFISLIHISFRQLLKHENTRSVLLTWIGHYLSKHSYLSQMWTHERVDVYAGVFPADTALLNLSSVLLKLCLPFCPVILGLILTDHLSIILNNTTLCSYFTKKQNPTDSNDTNKDNAQQPPKFLKIDATYCLATGLSSEDEKTNKGVHGKDMNNDTCLLTLQKESEMALPQKISDSYNFISESFFFTHRALYLGIHGLLNKFYRLNRELSHFEDVYRDAMMYGGVSDEVSKITEKFERGMRIYLSTKAALTDPSFLEDCMRLHATSARYLTQIAVTDNMDSLAFVELPISTVAATPLSLYCVPEYVIQNLVDLFVFLWRFSRSALALVDPFIHDFLLLISIYMGNKSRMSNPHLRASLADVFQEILPLSDSEEDSTYDQEISVEKEEIFKNCPYLPFLSIAVLQIFVDIEFTGDPHQFEEKFNYRRPLYKILQYMWTKRQCRNKIKDCVKESLANIDDTNHPLFLQFVNLLLNDSIFLLDEAMGFLTQIKTLELEKETGEWNELSLRERQTKESELKQLRMLARYHNIMANKTMDTLTYLTVSSEVKDLFCHPLLSDRIAAMLDDFLLKLVGPKMGALKVRDFSAYEFKPKVLVVDICKIYVNLCEREDFCRAVSRDGRSYSLKLFPSACRILRRIGEDDLQDKMTVLSDKIKLMSNQEEEDEELFSDAPDEFYDTLMSTLMTDPVILPSSKQVVDRATISRHLMSDPTDPFNRASLTMKDIIPHTELKNRIKEWIDKKRAEKSNGKTERQV